MFFLRKALQALAGIVPSHNLEAQEARFVSLTMSTSSQFPPPASPSPASLSSSSSMRLWRPAAQRNLRNQWSKLSTFWQQWLAASSGGKSHATSLVNPKRVNPSLITLISFWIVIWWVDLYRKMNALTMKFGALSDMDGWLVWRRRLWRSCLSNRWKFWSLTLFCLSILCVFTSHIESLYVLQSSYRIKLLSSYKEMNGECVCAPDYLIFLWIWNL